MMGLNRIVGAALLAVSALLLTAATPNWLMIVSVNGLAHRIGNPDAKVRLTEYVSYTCPHCAEFNREAEGAIQAAYIATGKVNVEVRHLIRDPVDLTVGMLAQCGPATKFPMNHTAFLSRQSDWIGPLARPTPTQRQRWSAPGAAGRRAIAGDFKLYDIMERRGYSRTETDRCLADEALAKQMADISAQDWDRPGVDSTPTFAINGLVMPGTHTWAALARQLEDFVRQTS